MEKRIISQTPDSKNSIEKKSLVDSKKLKSRLKYLVYTSEEMDGLSSESDLYHFFALKIFEIIQKKAIVVITLFNRHNQTFEVCSIKGLESVSGDISELLGSNFGKLHGQIVPEYHKSLELIELKEIPYNFIQLTKGVFSEKVAEKIVKITGIRKIYAIPFASQIQKFGSLTIFTTKETIDIDKELIEAFVLQFSTLYEKKAAQKQRDLSEIKYYKLFDATNVGVSVSTKEGKILDVNRAACEIIERSKEEVKKLRVRDFYYSESDRLKLLSLLAKNDEVDNFPVRFKAKGGKIKWINLSFKSIFIDDEECYISTLIDVTSTKEMELALLSRETELRKYIDESPLPIVILKKEGEIEYFNEKFSSIFGYKISDVITLENWWQKAYTDVEARQRAKAKWMQMLKDDHISADSYIVCKNGDKKFVEIHTTIIGEKVIAMFVDQTEKNRLEQENQNYRENLEELVKNRTAELEEKNKELERLNELFVGREFRIKELKDRIIELEKKIREN